MASPVNFSQSLDVIINSNECILVFNCRAVRIQQAIFGVLSIVIATVLLACDIISPLFSAFISIFLLFLIWVIGVVAINIIDDCEEKMRIDINRNSLFIRDKEVMRGLLSNEFKVITKTTGGAVAKKLVYIKDGSDVVLCSANYLDAKFDNVVVFLKKNGISVVEK